MVLIGPPCIFISDQVTTAGALELDLGMLCTAFTITEDNANTNTNANASENAKLPRKTQIAPVENIELTEVCCL